MVATDQGMVDPTGTVMGGDTVIVTTDTDIVIIDTVIVTTDTTIRVTRDPLIIIGLVPVSVSVLVQAVTTVEATTADITTRFHLAIPAVL